MPVTPVTAELISSALVTDVQSVTRADGLESEIERVSAAVTEMTDTSTPRAQIPYALTFHEVFYIEYTMNKVYEDYFLFYFNLMHPCIVLNRLLFSINREEVIITDDNLLLCFNGHNNELTYVWITHF